MDNLVFCFTDDHLASDGKKMRLGENLYHIVAHGESDGITVFGVKMSADELAKIIRKRNDYKGQEIALIGCSMGDDRNGEPFASHLAKRMGVEVIAATRVLWTDGTKDYIISSKAFDGRPDGKFKKFRG